MSQDKGLLRVAAVSPRIEFGRPEANLATILAWIDQAWQQNADLVCFPEVSLQGYCTIRKLVHDLAESVDGPSVQEIHRRAASLDVVVSVGMSLRDGEHVFNSQVFIGPDGVLGVQRKVHLCVEDEAYEPGGTWDSVAVKHWKIGTNICFDSEFPEPARVLAVKGIDILLMSFACGRLNTPHTADAGTWVDKVFRYAPSRAYDNQIFVVGFNHAGRVPDPDGYAATQPDYPAGTTHLWPGYCFALGPDGDLLAESDRFRHESNMLVVDLDPERICRARQGLKIKWPGQTVCGDRLEVRRTDTFGDILTAGRRQSLPPHQIRD
jgi:predicted amidohydrolase